jgi:hypothetical protein
MASTISSSGARKIGEMPLARRAHSFPTRLAAVSGIMRQAGGAAGAWCAIRGGKAKAAHDYYRQADQPAIASQRWGDLCHYLPVELCGSKPGPHCVVFVADGIHEAIAAVLVDVDAEEAAAKAREFFRPHGADSLASGVEVWRWDADAGEYVRDWWL